MLVHVNIQESCRFEDLVALRARFDFSVKMNEAVDSQFFLHLEINVAQSALETQLIFVFVRHVLMVVSGCLACEESGTIYKG